MLGHGTKPLTGNFDVYNLVLFSRSENVDHSHTNAWSASSSMGHQAQC